MKRYSKELIIGLSVAVAMLVLFFGIDYLKGINVFKAANYYYVSYTNVAGLTVSSPVTVNGFKVGQVRDINYEYDNPGHVLVELSLDKHLKVPAGSEAIIKSDIMGTATVELKFSTSADHHAVGDKLVGVTSPSMLDNVSAKLMPAVDAIVPKIDSLLSSVNTLVGDPALLAAVKRLDNITANLEASTVQLNRTLKSMPGVMGNVQGVAQNLDSITADLNKVTAELKSMPLSSTMDNVNAISANMKEVTGRLTSPDNSVGLLLNDRSIYDKLDSTVGNLDSLFIDIKKNPKRYISIKLL